jgi:hypothetical protein
VKALFLWLASASLAGAIELTTGALLGGKYDSTAFYVREGSGAWRKSCSGPAYRPEAAGKLMNLRLAQGLFHDEWQREVPFDPGRNTDTLIAALDTYKRHGVLMVNVSLQGGQAGYSPAVNGVDRRNGYKFGPDKGTHVSAFRPDGSLKPEWMARLEKLLREADRRGMIVNVLYFYQGQDELLENTAAIHRAARNATDWIVARNARNVFIDVANEFDLKGNWDHDRYIPSHIGELVTEVKNRFTKGWRAPVSASTAGSMSYPNSLYDTVDVVLVHGNNKSPEEKRKRLEALRGAPKPVLMNEDDNGRASTRENLAKELESCDILFHGAAGWGYMPWVQAQRFPFRFEPATASGVRDDMPERERDLVYFHDVLDHIAGLMLKKRPD